MRREAVRQRRRWELMRLQCFRKAGWRCEKCGRAGRLECDHVKPVSAGGEEWEASNLQALCRQCHVEKTRSEAVTGEPGYIADVAAWERYRATMRRAAAKPNPQRGIDL